MNPYFLQSVFIHAGEDGDGEDQRLRNAKTLGCGPGGFDKYLHHFKPSEGVEVEHGHIEFGGFLACLGHGIGNIVVLQVGKTFWPFWRIM